MKSVIPVIGVSAWFLVGVVVTVVALVLGYALSDWLYSVGVWPLAAVLRLVLLVTLLGLVGTILVYTVVGFGVGLRAIWARLR